MMTGKKARDSGPQTGRGSFAALKDDMDLRRTIAPTVTDKE
jgi:hypothetical protein